jgi:hypothetical protein
MAKVLAVGSSSGVAGSSGRIREDLINNSLQLPSVDLKTWATRETYAGVGLLVTKCSINCLEMNGAMLG